jgi:hypothetical protein
VKETAERLMDLAEAHIRNAGAFLSLQAERYCRTAATTSAQASRASVATSLPRSPRWKYLRFSLLKQTEPPRTGNPHRVISPPQQ